MNTINWQQKLSSRKFWSLIAGLIIAIGALVGWSDTSVEKIVALVSAVSVIVAYIFGEAITDSARARDDNK